MFFFSIESPFTHNEKLLNVPKTRFSETKGRGKTHTPGNWPDLL